MSKISHSFASSRFEEIYAFKIITGAKFEKIERIPDGHTSSVNSTCQLNSPFHTVSSCHIDPLGYNGQQNEQPATVTSKNDLYCSSAAYYLNKVLNKITAIFNLWLCTGQCASGITQPCFKIHHVGMILQNGQYSTSCFGSTTSIITMRNNAERAKQDRALSASFCTNTGRTQ